MSGTTPVPNAQAGSQPAVPGKLRFGEKVAVGTGGLPIFFGQYAAKSMAVSVYQMLLGVNPFWLGVVMAVPRFWDALIDPLIGNLSDNTRSRFGRRRPFILVGAVAMAASYGFIWMVSPAWSESAKLWYLLGTLLVFYTCYGIYSVGYQGLTFEMTPDYDERTQVMGHTSFWYKGGEFVYQWIFAISQMALFATPLIGVRTMNWIAAVFLLGLVAVIPAIYGRERGYARASTQPKQELWPAIRAGLRSKALMILITLTMLKLFAGMIGSNLDHYLLVYYVFDGDIAKGSFVKSVLASAYAVVGILSIPLLSWLCRRYGKKATLIGVYAGVVVAGVGKWFLFQPGVGWWVLLDPVLSAPILTAVTMVIPSMIADACDEDELRFGQRSEGMYGALYLWIQKTGVALALLGAGLALNLIHFDSTLGGNQAPETFLGMRLLLAGATIVTAVIAIIVAFFYPITRERAEETRRLLELRRGAT